MKSDKRQVLGTLEDVLFVMRNKASAVLYIQHYDELHGHVSQIWLFKIQDITELASYVSWNDLICQVYTPRSKAFKAVRPHAVSAPERQQDSGARASNQLSNVTSPSSHLSDNPSTDVEYDAVIIGAGMGGLATATQLATKGAKVVVLEK